MATLTIRNIDENLKQSLKIRAAHNDRSMEEEVRTILKNVINAGQSSPVGLGSRIHSLFMKAGGIELPEPSRSDKPRKPEMFS